MTTSTKTSLQKLVSALNASGWKYHTKRTTTKVPDKENPFPRSHYSSRNRYPDKVVPATEVYADNGVTEGDAKSFTATFTEDGAFLSDRTTGRYPFQAGTPLKKILDEVERYSSAAQQARVVARTAEEQAEQAEEERKVAEAFAEATETEQAAKRVAVEYLKENFGLAVNQSEALLSAMTTEDTILTNYASAKDFREHVGKGWRLGITYLRGTYIDGKRVG